MEEFKEDELRKRGKAKDTSKQLGVITRFNAEGVPEEGDDDDEHESNCEDDPAKKSMTKGSYVYLARRKQYGIVKGRPSDSQLLVKLKEAEPEGQDEVEVGIEEEDVRVEVEVPIRIVVSEDKRFTLTLRRPANDKIKVLAEELGDLLSLSKYALTFFYKGDKVGLGERLGDRDIGGCQHSPV